MIDAVVIGSGPNGLAAAVEIAREGYSTLVLEAAPTIGGGTRTTALTLPGYRHDVCSAVHPMGVLSPFFRAIPLGDYGLEWIAAPVSAAHPLDGEPAVALVRDLDETADGLGPDAAAYRRMLKPLLADPHGLLADLLAPLGIPKHPLTMARFGAMGLRSAADLAYQRFSGRRARAVFAGCAAHGVLPLDRLGTAAFGLVFSLTAHVEDWPVARGGSAAITTALARMLEDLGGRIETDRRITRFEELPPSRVVLFDTGPDQLASIAANELPSVYRERLRRFRYGPGTFKIDWALDGPIPWRDEACRQASTVHVGGAFEEVAAAEAAVWRGEHPDRPFVLVCQQSVFDPSRAPDGKHTGYAYCHVPSGSTVDRTDVIEAQIERFAPGFGDRILARHAMTSPDFERYDANYVGGAITGGVADLTQLFTRPVARIDPYATPNPKIFLCSASTPPGGGVHGMCGYHAARSALERLSA